MQIGQICRRIGLGFSEQETNRIKAKSDKADWGMNQVALQGETACHWIKRCSSMPRSMEKPR